jgi:mRNA interferase RelE/StbE
MAPPWILVMTPQSSRSFKKLDESVQKQITRYMQKKVLIRDNPFELGKPLQYHLKNAHRFRVDDWRILCTIQPNERTITIVHVGHRKDVYD